jgi:hypothetical protein
LHRRPLWVVFHILTVCDEPSFFDEGCWVVVDVRLWYFMFHAMVNGGFFTM